nr:hypothetical protein [Tanacetum cinerariifolium]
GHGAFSYLFIYHILFSERDFDMKAFPLLTVFLLLLVLTGMVQDSKATTVFATQKGGCYPDDGNDVSSFCCKDKTLVILKCWTRFAECDASCKIKP